MKTTKCKNCKRIVEKKEDGMPYNEIIFVPVCPICRPAIQEERDNFLDGALSD